MSLALLSARSRACLTCLTCVDCFVPVCPVCQDSARLTSRIRQRWAQLGSRQPVTLQPLPASPTRALDFASLNPCSGCSGAASASASVCLAFPVCWLFVRPFLGSRLLFRLLPHRLRLAWSLCSRLQGSAMRSVFTCVGTLTSLRPFVMILAPCVVRPSFTSALLGLSPATEPAVPLLLPRLWAPHVLSGPLPAFLSPASHPAVSDSIYFDRQSKAPPGKPVGRHCYAAGFC